jgi:hypothetical protein
MHFDDQLMRYFGTAELDTITPASLAAGLERMKVDFGLEKDRSRRFALWALMYVLGDAPELAVSFNREEDREAARHFMDLAAPGSPNGSRSTA